MILLFSSFLKYSVVFVCGGLVGVGILFAIIGIMYYSDKKKVDGSEKQASGKKVEPANSSANFSMWKIETVTTYTPYEPEQTGRRGAEVDENSEANLRKLLQEALKREDYELAASLRDKIKNLKK